MMFREVSVFDLTMNPFQMINNEWFLITAGNEQSYNTMTASWGTMGIFWAKPVVNAFVRTGRYTYGFMEENDLFTVSFYDESKHGALLYCGTKSGRDVDKAKETGLTPYFLDGTTAFEEAKLILVCKKVYAYDVKPEEMIDPSIMKFYTPEQGGFHRCYYGEILKAYVAE